MKVEFWTDQLLEKAQMKIIPQPNPSYADLDIFEKESLICVHCHVADLIELQEEITKFLKRKESVPAKQSGESP